MGITNRFGLRVVSGSALPWAPRRARRTDLNFFAQPPVDGADLFDPPAPVAVLELHDFGERPVEVVGDEGYLLVELFEGVASDSPGPFSRSSSNWDEHDGQVAVIRV